MMPNNQTFQVSQIWIGKPLNTQIQNWMNGIKEAALNSGHTYKCYTLDDLCFAFPNIQFLAALFAIITVPMIATFISDFARILILQKYRGLYLDSDIQITCKIFPKFPITEKIQTVEPNILLAPHKRNFPTTGLIFISEKVKQTDLDRLVVEYEKKIKEIFKNGITQGVTKILNSRDIPPYEPPLGPTFFRSIPVPMCCLPQSICINSKIETNAPLVHYGTVFWCKRHY